MDPFNRRLRRLTPPITGVQFQITKLIAGGRVRLVDGTLTGRADDAGCASKSEFGGHAAYGYCASKSLRTGECVCCLSPTGMAPPSALIVPDEHKLGQRPSTEVTKARIRLVIGSVFSTLKRRMRMEQHLAKTLAGLAQRIAQRLLAPTIGMFINNLVGRPPRALAAYDGR